MKYPTKQAIFDAQDANDFECLMRWRDELPEPRTEDQKEIAREIRSACKALGINDPIDFELGGEA
jgi:hypothetical protein